LQVKNKALTAAPVGIRTWLFDWRVAANAAGLNRIKGMI